jgi:hypothetical protein
LTTGRLLDWKFKTLSSDVLQQKESVMKPKAKKKISKTWADFKPTKKQTAVSFINTFDTSDWTWN